MGEYQIRGGRKILGEYRINGAKNAVLPILAATVLNSGVSVIRDCPMISDTYVSIDILKSIGCKVRFNDGTLIVDSSGADSCEIPENLFSVIFAKNHTPQKADKIKAFGCMVFLIGNKNF